MTRSNGQSLKSELAAKLLKDRTGATKPRAHADRSEEQLPATRPARRLSAWTPFPLDGLPDPLYSFVLRASAAIGCDTSMIVLPLLSAVASAIGNTRRIRLKAGWDEPCVLWTAIVSPSGTLKSPAIEAAVKPLWRRQADAVRRHQEAMEAWQREVELHKADVVDWRSKGRKAGSPPPDEPERPVCERFVCSDTTVEALAARLAENPRGLLLCRDELAGWLGSFNQYKSGKGSDAAHWLTIHGARDLLVDRKMGDRPTIYVRNAAVSVCGGIQPEILKLALGREHFQDGLAARLLVAMPPVRAKRWTEAEITDDDLSPLETLFDALLALQPASDENGQSFPRTVPLTSDGRQAWAGFYDEHAAEQADLMGDIAAAWSKLEAAAARLALLIHLVRQTAADQTLLTTDAVDSASVLAAVSMVRWFGNEARRVYGALAESDDERDRRELVELINRKGGRIAPRELAQSNRRYQPVDVAEAALHALIEAKLGTWEMIPTRTNKARVFALSAPSTSTDSRETSVLSEFVDVDTPDAADKGGA